MHLSFESSVALRTAAAARSTKSTSPVLQSYQLWFDYFCFYTGTHRMSFLATPYLPLPPGSYLISSEGLILWVVNIQNILFCRLKLGKNMFCLGSTLGRSSVASFEHFSSPIAVRHFSRLSSNFSSLRVEKKAEKMYSHTYSSPTEKEQFLNGCLCLFLAVERDHMSLVAVWVARRVMKCELFNLFPALRGHHIWSGRNSLWVSSRRQRRVHVSRRRRRAATKAEEGGGPVTDVDVAKKIPSSRQQHESTNAKAPTICPWTKKTERKRKKNIML